MTDKELLELAAKAAGMEGMRYASPHIGLVKMIDPTRPNETGSVGPDWNPLTDDGDALRLAVKLNLFTPEIIEDWKWCQDKSKYADVCANYRHAIVRAAAEIGKEMKCKE